MPRVSREKIQERENFVRECRLRGMSVERVQDALVTKDGMKMSPGRLAELFAEPMPIPAQEVRKEEIFQKFGGNEPLPSSFLASEEPAIEPKGKLFEAVKKFPSTILVNAGDPKKDWLVPEEKVPMRPPAVQFEIDLTDPEIRARVDETRKKFGKGVYIIDMD
jgi:hypothetical protein